MVVCACGVRLRVDGSCNTSTCEHYRASLRGARLNKGCLKKVKTPFTSASKKGGGFASRSINVLRKHIPPNPLTEVLLSAVAEPVQDGRLERDDAQVEQNRLMKEAVALKPRKDELAQILWSRLDTLRRMTSSTDACFIIGGALRLLAVTEKLQPSADDVAVAALLSSAVALNHPDEGYDLRQDINAEMVRDALRRMAGAKRLQDVLDAECFILASTRIAHLNSGSTDMSRTILTWERAAATVQT